MLCELEIVFLFVFQGNHKKMLLATGYKAENIKEYRYFDNGTNSLDFDGMCADLEVTWLSIHVSGQINIMSKI